MIQTIKLCQQLLKKELKKLGFCGTINLRNGDVFFNLSTNYINDLNNLTSTMYIALYYIFY